MPLTNVLSISVGWLRRLDFLNVVPFRVGEHVLWIVVADLDRAE